MNVFFSEAKGYISSIRIQTNPIILMWKCVQPKGYISQKRTDG